MGIQGKFAYDTFRPGQRELAQRVYDACSGGEILLAEAMSGFGKTSAVLTGALSAAEETGSKVVYCCRTKRQIQRVVDEISRLQKKHPFNAASMLAKFDYCLLRRQRNVPRESFGWYCSFNVSNNLCSYFLNVPLVGADFDKMVTKVMQRAPDHVELLHESESLHVCPYEVARLAMVQATVAVTPYHYVFDPRSTPVLFDRNLIDRKKTMLVVDEAHNLRDFFRGLHSATLTLDQIQGAIREAEALMMEEASHSLATMKFIIERAMAKNNGWRLDKEALLEEFRKDCGTVWLQNLAFELSASSGAAWGSITFERRLPSLILTVGQFLSMLTSSAESVLVGWEGTLGLIDPNPVEGLASYLEGFKSSILVSATINPSPVFKRSLGLGVRNPAVYEVSAAPQVAIKTIVDTAVSTRYKKRSPQMFSEIAGKVAAIIRETPKGVGVFVPSYAVLTAVFELVSKKLNGRNLVAEAPGLSSEGAADLFDSFRGTDDSVLFAVQGGRFSEGEDFREDMMGSVVVVGMSMPPPSPMLYAEYACLKRAGEPDSFLMLSRLPALRKAFQAAGRHVRNPGKRGLVFLLDDRFSSQAVVDLMPSWLRRDLVAQSFTPLELASLTREFWAFLPSQPFPS